MHHDTHVARSHSDMSFAGGLGLAALGAALLGIALNDSGVVSGTSQGNLGVTIPIALAGIAGAYLAQSFYRRHASRDNAAHVSEGPRSRSQNLLWLLLVLAVAAPGLAPSVPARSIVIAVIGALLLVAGVRDHMHFQEQKRVR